MYIITKKLHGITYYWNGTYEPQRWCVQWEGLRDNAQPVISEDRDSLVDRLLEADPHAEYGYIKK